MILLLALVFSTSESSAAITKLWQQRHDGPPGGDTRDEAIKVLPVGANDLVVVGTTIDSYGPKGDVLAIKYSGTDGSILWSRRYNGTDNLDDKAVAAAVDLQGNLYVTAEVRRREGGLDFYTAKYAASDGALLWERLYSGPGNRVDQPTSIAVDAAGNAFVAGHSNAANDDIYVVKYAAADGALQWEKRYNSPEDANDYARAIVVDSAGDVVLTGSSDFRFYTAKYRGADGSLAWERRDGGPGIGILEGEAITLDANEDIIVTGEGYGPDSYNIYTAKYTKADGALIWQKIYDGGTGILDRSYSLAVDPGGNVIVGGVSGTNLYIAEYRGADGALQWEKLLLGGEANPFADGIFSLVENTNGNLFAVGGWYLASFSGSDGAILWSKTNSIGGAGRSIALDTGGNLLVAGSAWDSSEPAPSPDFHTAKYAPSDGALIWEKRYTGIAASLDYGSFIAMDLEGDVIISGTTTTNKYTAKYRKNDGRLLWSKIDQPDSEVTALGVDSAGDVALTGWINTGTNAPSIAEMFTAKRSGLDGAILWEKRFNLGDGRRARGWALAVDSSGNIVATGTFGTQTNDIYTAKYRGSGGQLLWEKRHASPNGGNDGGYAIALDRNQDAFVVGILDWKFFIAKLASSDGSILWEQQRPFTNNYVAQWTRVLVAQNGDVLASASSFSQSYLARFRGDNGAVLWERIPVQPESIRLNVLDIALDSAGNLVTGGFREQFRNRGSAFFAKYAAGDGALIWERTFGADEVTDQSAGVLVDDADDVIAAMQTYGARGFSPVPPPFTMLKLAGNDGTVLSEYTEQTFSPANFVTDRRGRIAVTGGDYDLVAMVLQDQPRARIMTSVNQPGVLNLRWPEQYTGWRLETLQNSGGISPGGWTVIAGSTATNSVTIPIENGAPPSFYRLVQP